MSADHISEARLVRFVLDELPPREAGEIETHLGRCESCREAVEQFRRLLACTQDLAAVPVEEHRVESANREVLRAAKTQNKDQSRRQVPLRAALFGRTIMSNRMMKIAVAAVVAVAVILGLSLFTGDGAGKTYAQVVDQLHNAHTLTFSTITRTGVESMPTVRVDYAYRDTGHIRTTTADGYITVVETTDAGARGISLVPPTKSYIVFEVTGVPKDVANDPWTTVERLRALPTEAGERLGRREMDGRMLDGFVTRADDATTTVWVDSKTGELVRAEVEFASAPGMSMTLTDFQFDAVLDDSLFSVQPPAGYTPVQVAADASQVTEQDFVKFLRLWTHWTVDASFPPNVTGVELAKVTVQMAREGKFVGPYVPEIGEKQQADIMYRGMVFVTRLPAGTWRYAGQNVHFGDPTVPIFWYQPAGSSTCRVIYADLHVIDVAPENLPK